MKHYIFLTNMGDSYDLRYIGTRSGKTPEEAHKIFTKECPFALKQCINQIYVIETLGHPFDICTRFPL